MTKIQEIYIEEFMKKFPQPHYLLEKDVEDWDKYDWSNYKAIVEEILKE